MLTTAPHFDSVCISCCVIPGTRLLTGGEVIQLWTVCQENSHEEDPPHRTVKFSVGLETGKEETLLPEHERDTIWITAWRCKYVARFTNIT